MIPARLGSQRLKKKNLQLLKGKPLIMHTIEKALYSNLFDEVWVNTESDVIGELAVEAGAGFHKRPEELANNQATSEDFIYEFFQKHECDFVVQIHSIAPLLTSSDIESFVKKLNSDQADVLLSTEKIQLECAFNGDPVNFEYSEKTNSQELIPIQKISWSISAWRKKTFLYAVENGLCATYSGKLDYFPISKMAGHVIKTQEDLDIAHLLFDFVHDK